MFDDNKVKMARKPGKKQKENPVRRTGEGKRRKGNKRNKPPVFEFGGDPCEVLVINTCRGYIVTVTAYHGYCTCTLYSCQDPNGRIILYVV